MDNEFIIIISSWVCALVKRFRIYIYIYIYISWVYKTNLNVLSAWKDGGAVGDGGGVWHTGCTCKYSVFITTSLPYEDELSTTLMAMSSLNASSFLFHNDWRLLCTAARYWKLIIMMTLCYQYMKIRKIYDMKPYKFGS